MSMLSPTPSRSGAAKDGDSERLLGSPDPSHPGGVLSPIHLLSSPGTTEGEGQTLQVRHIMHDDNPAAGLKKSRRLAAVVLPLLMICVTMLIEKHEVTATGAAAIQQQHM